MLFSACPPEDDGEDEFKGFTLTDIPEAYNGKYAYLVGFLESTPIVIGAQSVNMTTGTATQPKISNGSVNIPLCYPEGATVKPYSGNHTVVIQCTIINSANPTADAMNAFEAIITFNSVAFSSGNATKSWNDNDGEYIP